MQCQSYSSHPLSDFGMILHIVGVNSNIFAHKLIKDINLAHDFHYFDGRVNSNVSDFMGYLKGRGAL